MRTIIIVILIWAVLISVAACNSRLQFQDPFTRPQIDWKPNLLLDKEKVDRILGHQSHLEKVTAYIKDGTRTYQSVFHDDDPDPSTGKTGILYYMYEEYQTAAAAKSFLDSTLKSNHIDPANGVQMGNGAELHYLTGVRVIRMVMILKEKHLIRLKVNPATSRYSSVEFQKVAVELANQL